MTFLPTLAPVTANDRFKSRQGDWFSIGLIFAALAHGSLFLFFPELRAAEVTVPVTPPIVIERPPAVALPAPPQEIGRPRTPRVAAVMLEDEGPYQLLPLAPRYDRMPGRVAPHPDLPDLPPVPPGAEPESIPSFVPRDEEPILSNRAELVRELQERYPPALREAGIGGTAQLYVYVAETGSVTNARLKRSSGLAQLDEVAIDIIRHAEFTPAVLGDEPVGVWIELPVSFQTR